VEAGGAVDIGALVVGACTSASLIQDSE